MSPLRVRCRCRRMVGGGGHGQGNDTASLRMEARAADHDRGSRWYNRVGYGTTPTLRSTGATEPLRAAG